MELPIRFRRTARRWGNSVVFAIPQEILEALSLKVGDEVSISIEGNRMIVERETD